MAKTSFTNDEMDEMFCRVKISRKEFHKVLHSLGPVKPDDPIESDRWKRCLTERGVPTYGYCHRTTEVLYRMEKIPKGFQARRVPLPAAGESHYFLMRIGAQPNRDGRFNPDEVIDLTADQFAEGCDYSNSRAASFPNKSKIARLIMDGLDKSQGKA